MFIQPIRPDDVETSVDLADRLNTVKISRPQLQAALQERSTRGDSGNRDMPALALEARTKAMDDWTTEHDPRQQSNREAVIEAAAVFPLSALSTGIGFEPDGFQEMILFVEELPW